MEEQTELDSLRQKAMRYEYEIAKLQSEISKNKFEIAKISERRMKAITEESSSNAIKTTKRYNAALASTSLKKIESQINKAESEILKRSKDLHSIRAALNHQLKSTEAIFEKKERSRLDRLTENYESEHASASEKTEQNYEYLPNDGAFHIITGVNGTGKSRYLRKLVDFYLKKPYYQKIICLTGTMFEKFPNRNTTTGKNKYPIICEYLYFGNKSINNVFSERRPFQSLVDAMLKTGYNGIQGSLAGDLFEEIGFERSITLEFQQKNSYSERNSKKKIVTALFLDLSETLQTDENSRKIFLQLKDNEISLSNIVFHKPNEVLNLNALSSGERLYLLAIMALCFCVSERTLVLFDEPENSLHPQWQAKIMQDIVSIHKKLTKKCTVVVATHSPLIVSSAPNKDTFIAGLPSNDPWIKSELFGQNSDSVLADQFGVMSPRSIKATQLIQECLTSLVDIEANPSRFIKAVDKLKNTKIIIQDSDPLKTAITKIFEIREKYS